MARFVLLSSGEYENYCWNTLIDLGRDAGTDDLERVKTEWAVECRKAQAERNEFSSAPHRRFKGVSYWAEYSERFPPLTEVHAEFVLNRLGGSIADVFELHTGSYLG